MIKKNEINIVVAMKREAFPLISYWDLKENRDKFYSNKKKKINLIISGIGKKKSEKATKYLGEKTNKNSFFVNNDNGRNGNGRNTSRGGNDT